MKLEIALIGPPGAGSVREDIARSYRGRRPPGSLWNGDVAMYPHNANNLPLIDKIGVSEAIEGGQAPPIHSRERCNLAHCIPMNHHVWYGATRTEGLRFCLSANESEACSQYEQDQHHTNAAPLRDSHQDVALEVLRSPPSKRKTRVLPGTLVYLQNSITFLCQTLCNLSGSHSCKLFSATTQFKRHHKVSPYIDSSACYSALTHYTR